MVLREQPISLLRLTGEAVKFFRALALRRLLPAAQTSYVLHLMEHIVPSESWGLGPGGFTVSVAFKGGWGPEPSGSYLVRQSGIIDPGSSRGLAVSVVAYPPVGADSLPPARRGSPARLSCTQGCFPHLRLRPGGQSA